jgi:hypothetical protein
MAPAAAGLDVTYGFLLLTAAAISQATMGGVRYIDVLEMDYGDFEALCADLSRKDGGEDGQ